METSEWAAWVQAIGSVVALAIAIAIPYAQNRKAEEVRREDLERRERDASEARRRLAIDHAIVIFDSIFEWESTCEEHRIVINRAPPSSQQKLVELLSVQFVRDGVPDHVKALFGRLHELGDAAVPVQMAVVLLGTLKQNVEILFAFKEGRVDRDQVGEIEKIVHDHLFRTFSAITAAKDALLVYYSGRGWFKKEE